MKFSLLLLIFLIPFSVASCSENQIDINSASINELDKLDGIGAVYAQRIIDSRPFLLLDDLISVKGIGPTTLQKIKSQGLACVSSENSEDIYTSLEESSGNTFSSSEAYSSSHTENIINLNSDEDITQKVQKEEVVFESKNEKVKRYLIFVFAFFLILIILFLLLTNNGTNYSSSDDY